MWAVPRNTFGTCSFGLCLSSLQRARARGRKIVSIHVQNPTPVKKKIAKMGNHLLKSFHHSNSSSLFLLNPPDLWLYGFCTVVDDDYMNESPPFQNKNSHTNQNKEKNKEKTELIYLRFFPIYYDRVEGKKKLATFISYNKSSNFWVVQKKKTITLHNVPD